MPSKPKETMDKYCGGGEIGMAKGGQVEEMDDEKSLLEHVALECMHGIEMKDKQKFLEAFQVLVAHICQSMSEPDEMEGE